MLFDRSVKDQRLTKIGGNQNVCLMGKSCPLGFHLCCVILDTVLGVCVPFPLGVLGMEFDCLTFEPRHEKTCLRCLRPGKAQIGLLSYRH